MRKLYDFTIVYKLTINIINMVPTFSVWLVFIHCNDDDNTRDNS